MSGFENNNELNKMHTKLFVKLATIETTTDKIEKHLLDLNSKVATNQDKIQNNRNDITQIITQFTDIIERSKERDNKNDDIIKAINDLRVAVDDKFSKTDERLKKLENWKYYVAGVVAVSLIIANIAIKFI